MVEYHEIKTLPLLYTLNGPTGKVAVEASPKDTVPLTTNGTIFTGKASMLKARLNTIVEPDQAVLTVGVTA